MAVVGGPQHLATMAVAEDPPILTLTQAKIQTLARAKILKAVVGLQHLVTMAVVEGPQHLAIMAVAEDLPTQARIQTPIQTLTRAKIQTLTQVKTPTPIQTLTRARILLIRTE